MIIYKYRNDDVFDMVIDNYDYVSGIMVNTFLLLSLNLRT